MRTLIAFVCVASLLASCGDARSTKITPALLEDTAKLQHVANRLAPEDRSLFGRYVMGRVMTAGGFGKPLVNASGKDPATVGEAIQLVKAVDALNARLEAFDGERSAKRKVLEAKHDRLSAVAEAAGWAPPEVEASNAVIDELNAFDAETEKLRSAIK